MNKKPGTLYYLASPYTHKNPVIKKQRADVATKAAVDLLKNGIFCFAPIPYNAPWENYNLPGDWGFWEKFDKTFISRCDAVLVLTIDGWKESIGVQAEIEYAKENDIPVLFITPEEIESGKVLNLERSDV
jgi:hypothetical protein